MTVLFISDLHLDAKQKNLTALFHKFIANHCQNIEALYILGDLFEIWMGDDDDSQFHQSIMASIKSLPIPVYFMSGNRDFLIGNDFSKKTGCTLLKDPCVIELYGQSILLTHGDCLCTDDKLHQLFRKVTRAHYVKKAFLRLPLEFRRKIARAFRDKSKSRTQKLDTMVMDAHPNAIKNLMEKFSVTQIIYGHTHKPSITLFDNKYIYVLSDWGKQGNYLCCEDDGTKRLVYFD